MSVQSDSSSTVGAKRRANVSEFIVLTSFAMSLILLIFAYKDNANHEKHKIPTNFFCFYAFLPSSQAVLLPCLAAKTPLKHHFTFLRDRMERFYKVCPKVVPFLPLSARCANLSAPFPRVLSHI